MIHLEYHEDDFWMGYNYLVTTAPVEKIDTR